jgi:hypothetical protein
MFAPYCSSVLQTTIDNKMERPLGHFDVIDV